MTLAKRIESIDSLRGVAIIMVLLYHVHAWIPGASSLPSWYLFPMSLGFSGVDLFFVLSGFSLYYAWRWQETVTSDISVKKYYWRRFWRIYPPYIIAFLLPWIPIVWSAPYEAVQEALWHVVLLHNFSEKHFYGANGPLWSIAVEVQFYIVFPLVVLLIKRWGVTRVVFAGIVLSLLYRTGVYLYFQDVTYRQVPKPYLQGFWLARIPNFLLGIFIASRRIDHSGQEGRNSFHASMWIIAGIVAIGFTWVIVYFFRHASMVVRELGFATGYAFIVYGALRGAIPAILSLRWLRYTGKVSYSLYLTHAPIILLLGAAFKDWVPRVLIGQTFLMMVAAITISYLAAVLFYQWIEIPFLNMARRYR